MNNPVKEAVQSEGRRVKFVMINPAAFMSLFTEGLKIRKGWKIMEGIPEDAKIITVVYDSLRNGFIVLLESEKYPPVQEGVMPPIQPISIKISKG
jgi:hypothetical protein